MVQSRLEPPPSSFSAVKYSLRPTGPRVSQTSTTLCSDPVGDGCTVISTCTTLTFWPLAREFLMHPLTSPPPISWEMRTLAELKTQARVTARGQPGGSWTGWEKGCVTTGQLRQLKLVPELLSLQLTTVLSTLIFENELLYLQQSAYPYQQRY